MKLKFVLFVGAYLLVVIKAWPTDTDNTAEIQSGIPATAGEDDNQQTLDEEPVSNPLARDKRHKKKTIIVNQYYGRPGYYGWNNGYSGWNNHGWGHNNGWGHSGGYFGGYGGWNGWGHGWSNGWGGNYYGNYGGHRGKGKHYG